MTEHPSAYQLEAHAVGETNDSVSDHLKTCEVCQVYVSELNEARSAMLNERPPAMFLAQPEIAAALSEADSKVPFFRRINRWLLAPIAITACAIFFLMQAPVQDRTSEEDTLLMKGHTAQLEVLRMRSGETTSHSGKLSLKKGDRIRIRVRLAAPRMLSVGILTAEKSWTEIAPVRLYERGVHWVHTEAFETDDSPQSGRILAGTPQAIQDLRSGQQDVDILQVIMSSEKTP